MASVNCIKCKHYYVTWQPKAPNGCRAYGFKSRQMPSVVVKSNSGIDCNMYEEKRKKQ